MFLIEAGREFHSLVSRSALFCYKYVEFLIYYSLLYYNEH